MECVRDIQDFSTRFFLQQLCALITSPNISTGGTISNLYALLVARFAFEPRGKKVGLKEVPKMCCFTSESVSKAKHKSMQRKIILILRVTFLSKAQPQSVGLAPIIASTFL
ncbi:unnamed protein product [Strongylus vulgaris]|uniref:Uncharacterized protein n=1 Tax=Strongylus vulgaris TaxID=40348 RepID=A0A3P7J6E6_STRVU|nr:unnamed protein product [Strongylus vulgaris]